jgi:hypothetical protein
MVRIHVQIVMGLSVSGRHPERTHSRSSGNGSSILPESSFQGSVGNTVSRRSAKAKKKAHVLSGPLWSRRTRWTRCAVDASMVDSISTDHPKLELTLIVFVLILNVCRMSEWLAPAPVMRYNSVRFRDSA